MDACNGWDFDLYVKQPAGTYIGFTNRGDLATTPFVRYARDSFAIWSPWRPSSLGRQPPTASTGSLSISWVDAFMFNPSWTGSLASVQLYLGAALSQNYAIPPGDLRSQ